MTHPLLPETLDLLDGLVACPSVSADSNLGVIDLLANRLSDAGARVEILQDGTGTKANLWATLGPDVDGGLVLSGHTDVVPVADQPWTVDPFGLTRRDDRVMDRGTCDMKGFLAAAVAMAPTLGRHIADRPLHFAFTHDEEVGCLGGQALVATLKDRGVRPQLAILGEPTSMRIVDGHKGCCEYSTRFAGYEGHGSTPALGVNAVEYATLFASRLLALRDALAASPPPEGRFDPPHTTLNIGALQGGTAHNVIPGYAQLDWEMRPVQKSDHRRVWDDLNSYTKDVLLPAMQAVHPDAWIETETIGDVVGLLPMPENAARDLVMALTGANGTHLVPFSTEAGLFQEIGMDVVLCGPGDIAQAHKPDEWLALSQLDDCLGMLERLGPRL